MARMSLDTAIRLSAEVKGGGNITKVQRSLQDLAKGSKITARDMQTLRAATFQYARANTNTVAGIRNSITAFRGLQEQVKIGSREFKRYGTEIQKLEGKLRGIDGTAEKAGRSMGQNLAAGLAAAGIGRALRGITMQAATFEGELRKAAAIEGSEGSFGILKKEIEAVASAAAGTPTEVAALATALSRAGFSAKETTDALRGIVRGAEATSVTFEEMGSIAADNLRSFGLQTNETARVVDVLTQTAFKSNQTVLDLGESMKYAAPIARNLGVPLEDLAAVMGLLANNGIRGSDAGTALRTGLTRLQIAAGGADSEIASLTRGNVQLTKAMATLGSEILDTNGKLRPLDQVLNGLRNSLSGLSATDQAILAKALFGTEAGSKFQALLNSTEGQVRQMFAAIRDSDGVAEKTQKQMQGFGYSVKVLGGNFEYLTNQIGGAIGLALKPFVDVLNAAIGAAQNLPGPIKALGAAAAAAGIATLGLVAAAAALKAGLAVIGITGVVTALKGLVGVSVAARVQMLALNATVLLNPWTALAAGIGAATYALATYRSESEKIGGKAATGDAAALAAAQRRITAKQQEISALEGQRPGARTSRGGDLARARVELAQLQRDVQTGRRAAGGGVVPGNAMGTPIGDTVGGGGGGGGGGGDKPKKQSAEDRIAAKPFGREIIAAAKANSVDPALFAALVAQESGFDPNARGRRADGSFSGAFGLSQLMPGTARELGVNPRDPMQNLMGGAKYLRQQLDRFGLEGGLRAYNQGPGAQQRTPGGNSQESREYPGKVLARYKQFAGGSEGMAGLEAEGIKAQTDAAEKLREQLREQLKAADSINTALKDRLALAQTTEPVARQMLEYDIKQNELAREYEQLKSAAGPDELILLNANLIIELQLLQIENEEKQNSLLAERATLMANIAAQAAMPTVYNELETQEAALQAVLDKYPAIGAAADAASTLATSGVSEMIAGTKDAKEVFVDFLSSIADALMDTAKQMIAQYIAIGIARMFAGMGSSVATDAGGWATSFATPQPGVGTGFNFNAGAMTGGTPWSFAGGGYTGNAPRAGGVDGQGGFPAILHPRETVIDHTRAISRQGAATMASAPVSVTVNVDASGNSQVSGDQNQGAQLGRVIAGAVQQELVRQKRPGGLLAS
jgi:TP901 family phage tail tape measure protein